MGDFDKSGNGQESPTGFGKQMGKKRKFQLPDAPEQPIMVQDRYDNFYREQLLRAVREDYESFPEGLPTYHSYVCAVVASYASEVADPEQLGVKDLGNFLKGMNSHVPKIKVLDTFMQVANPQRAKSFRVDRYSQYVGEAFAGFFESPELFDISNEAAEKIEELTGIYEIEIPQIRGRYKMDTPPRILALLKSNNRKYLFSYEFNYENLSDISEVESENLKLVSGICVVKPKEFLVAMRDYLTRDGRLGRIYVAGYGTARSRFLSDRPRDHGALFSVTDESSNDERTLVTYHVSGFIGFGHRWQYNAKKISNNHDITKIKERIDKFYGVV